MTTNEFGPGCFNFSAWSRDHIDKGEPSFKIGDRVMLTLPLYICDVFQDCDGTPLFACSHDDPADFTDEERANSKRYWFRVSHLSADSFRKIGPEQEE